MRRYRLMLLLLVSAAALALLWYRTPRKGIPAFGGSALSVRLPDVAHFQQNDPRWAGDRLGNLDNGDTLGSAGCMVASVATAMTNLGHATDPGKLNAALAAEGAFTPRGWLMWYAISRVSKGGMRAEVHADPSLAKLDACLARGDYPIVKFLIGGVIPHWVVLIGKHEGTYFMRDPLIDEPAPAPLTRRTQIILSVRCIGRTPQTTVATKP